MVNNLMMVMYQGVFIIGEMDGQKLLGPRLYGLLQTGQGEFRHSINPPPGNPGFVHLPKDIMYWPIVDKAIENLYIKATTGIVIPDESLHVGGGKVSLVQ